MSNKRLALQAAASVLLAFELGACRGSLPVAVNKDPTTGQEDLVDVEESDGEGTGKEGESGEDSPGQVPDPDDEAPGTGTPEDNDEVPSAPICIDVAGDEQSECCQELSRWCEEHAPLEEQMDCVYGPDFDGSTGCIPWGPPVPPSMV